VWLNMETAHQLQSRYVWLNMETAHQLELLSNLICRALRK
ncbi:hypothetical protein ACNUYO_003161, partial [Escherichia coli]